MGEEGRRKQEAEGGEKAIVADLQCVINVNNTMVGRAVDTVKKLFAKTPFALVSTHVHGRYLCF